MKSVLITKLQAGRPVALNSPEAALLVEALRRAMATTLEVPLEQVADDARVFDDLGLDSIDVFDTLDQLSAEFEVPVALDELPEGVLRGGEQTTFLQFADGLLRYFREPPRPPAQP